MSTKQGKFVLFDLAEFAAWLEALPTNRAIALIQNHHTWSPAYAHFKGTNHFSLLSGMESAHLARGFAEISQNLTIFPDGTVAVCRSLDKTPAGIKGANTRGICIENVGNFDQGGDAMSAAQRDAIVQVNALLCRKYHLTPGTDTIVYHHWYDLVTGERKDGLGSTKTCPGTAFFGGNQVADAAAHFLPLVQAAYAGTTPVAPPPPVLASGPVTADVLNVRAAPGTTAKIVKKLTKGIVVNAYAIDGVWWRIHPTEQHWVHSRYVQK